MIDLTKTTFLIPALVESIDRLRNINSVLGYLNSHFRTKVIIHEVFDVVSKIETDTFTNLEITHIQERMNDGFLHRTRQLNEMLSIATTPVVCNYDTDVILPVESYVISQYLLENELFDVVYPFGLGMYQKKVSRAFDQRTFNESFDISHIPADKITIDHSEYGHCIFFNTQAYKSIGGENEEFLSYGPEDCERYDRCFNFGLRIHRIRDYVIHFEHERTSNSNEKNVHFKNNVELYEKMKRMNADELIQHYSRIKYLDKYKFKVHKNDKKNIDTPQKEVSTRIIETVKEPQIGIRALPPLSFNVCTRCGEPKNTMKYNFCQKCKKLY